MCRRRSRPHSIYIRAYRLREAGVCSTHLNLSGSSPSQPRTLHTKLSLNGKSSRPFPASGAVVALTRRKVWAATQNIGLREAWLPCRVATRPTPFYRFTTGTPHALLMTMLYLLRHRRSPLLLNTTLLEPAPMRSQAAITIDIRHIEPLDKQSDWCVILP